MAAYLAWPGAAGHLCWMTLSPGVVGHAADLKVTDHAPPRGAQSWHEYRQCPALRDEARARGLCPPKSPLGSGRTASGECRLVALPRDIALSACETNHSMIPGPCTIALYRAFQKAPQCPPIERGFGNSAARRNSVKLLRPIAPLVGNHLTRLGCEQDLVDNLDGQPRRSIIGATNRIMKLASPCCVRPLFPVPARGGIPTFDNAS